MKKIFLIFSNHVKEAELYIDIVSQFLRNGDEFYYYGADNNLSRYLSGQKAKKQIVDFGRDLSITQSFYFLELPKRIYLQIKIFFWLLIKKMKYKNLIIFCSDINERLLVTPWAKLLRLKIFWVESREIEYGKIKAGNLKKYLKLLGYARVIAFAPFLKEIFLSLGFQAQKINFIYIPPGIEIGVEKYQDNIFSGIAKQDHSLIGKKFFSVGTIYDFADKARLEFLFNGIRKSLRFIPKIQLLIINDNNYRQEDLAWAKWLAKKLDLDNLVWFISEPKNMLKWLNSLDVFVVNANKYDSDNLLSVLRAMSAGLPVLVPDSIGCEEIVKDNKNGIYFHVNNSDSFSEKLILLDKNRNLRNYIKINAAQTPEKSFVLRTTIAKIEELL
jgi:glycosyltransferase involved in cell wall biosynthesis